MRRFLPVIADFALSGVISQVERLRQRRQRELREEAQSPASPAPSADTPAQTPRAATPATPAATVPAPAAAATPAEAVAESPLPAAGRATPDDAAVHEALETLDGGGVISELEVRMRVVLHAAPAAAPVSGGCSLTTRIVAGQIQGGAAGHHEATAAEGGNRI